MHFSKKRATAWFVFFLAMLWGVAILVGTDRDRLDDVRKASADRDGMEGQRRFQLGANEHIPRALAHAPFTQ